MKVTFVKSASQLSECPPPMLPEVAVVGRSNAGKSSLLNAVFAQKLAKVSGTPGKTRLMNFFQQGREIMWVDLPGYGFAARSMREKNHWKQMIEAFLSEREPLIGLVLVMDIRRSWSAEEELLSDWCMQAELPLLIVLNKSDKLGFEQQLKAKAALQQNPWPVFVVSSMKRKGVSEVVQFIKAHWCSENLA